MTTFPHVKLDASGTLGTGGGNEIWSCGLKVGVRDPGAPATLIAPTQDDVDEISAWGVDPWTEFITTGGLSSSLISQWVTLRTVKASPVSAAGAIPPAQHSTITDVLPAVTGSAVLTPSGSSAGAGQTPYTVAVVVTLTGPLYPRGSAAYGRFYIPIPNLGVDSTSTSYQAMTNGLMSANSTAELALRAGNLLSQINGITLTSGNLASVCNIGRSEDLAGIRWQLVDTVTVDNRPDTVRRRSNKISGEGKQTSPVV